MTAKKPSKRAPRAGAVIPLRLSDDEVAWLDSEAEQAGTTRNEVIRGHLAARRRRTLEERREAVLDFAARNGFDRAEVARLLGWK